MKHNPITRSKCIHKERGRRTGDTRPRAQLSEATAAIAGSLLHPEIMISGELRLYLWNLLFCIQCRYSIPVQPHVPRRAKVNMGYRQKKGGTRRTGAQLPLWSYGRKGLSQGRRWASWRELRGPQERQGPRPGQRLQRQPRSPRLQRGAACTSFGRPWALWPCASLPPPPPPCHRAVPTSW